MKHIYPSESIHRHWGNIAIFGNSASEKNYEISGYVDNKNSQGLRLFYMDKL